MSIFWCQACDKLIEVPNNFLKKEVKCPTCQQVTPIYSTLGFIKQLLKQLAKHQKTEIPNTSVPTLTQATAETYLTQLKIHPHFVNENNVLATDSADLLNLAELFAANYGLLQTFFSKLQRVYAKGFYHFKLNVALFSATELTNLLNIMRRLYQLNYLENYHYQSNKQHIFLKLTRDENKNQFLNKKWLQIYLKQTCQRVFPQAFLAENITLRVENDFYTFELLLMPTHATIVLINYSIVKNIPKLPPLFFSIPHLMLLPNSDEMEVLTLNKQYPHTTIITLKNLETCLQQVVLK